jgi:glycosyltransferase 2 family protein
MNEDEPTPEPMARFRKWAALVTAVAALGYIAYAGFKGFTEVGSELAGFSWPIYAAVLGLTLVNYGLRFFKWHYLLYQLDVKMPIVANMWVFASGLAMVISPGKAGEVVKPYLVKAILGTPMVRTIPALVAERGTDGIAVIILAAVGVSTYYADQTRLIYATLAVCAVGMLVLASKTLMHAMLLPISWVSVQMHGRLLTAYDAMRTCLAPIPLFVTVLASLAAWWAECVGMWLVFKGLSVDAGLDLSTFLYAFATVFGAPMPGGMGMADAALVEGAEQLIVGIGPGKALAASLLIRIATLWLGVLLGAVALLRIESVIAHAREAVGGTLEA